MAPESSVADAIATVSRRTTRDKLWAVAYIVLGATAVLFAISQLFLLPVSHDELHYCHTAWLAHHGERPFTDFLFHNSPGTLYLLRLYGLWNADFSAEIMVFGRVVCTVSLLATAAMLVLLGERLYGWRIGVLAGGLAFPLMVVPYNAETFRKQHWSLRPEIVGMPLAFVSLYLTLRITSASHLKRPFLSGFLAAACAAVAIFFSPRFSFLCIGLALVVLVNLRGIPRATIAGMIVGACIAPGLYLATVGIADTQTWIIKYTAVVRDPSQGRFDWLRMHIGKFILVASSIQAAFYLWRAPNKSFRDLAIVQLALMSAAVLEPKPSFASWQMGLLTGSLLVSYLLVVLLELQTLAATAAFVVLFAALWLYPARALRNNVRLFQHPELMLSEQVAASNAFGRALGDEKGVFNPQNHPVVAHDASYFWTQFPLLRRALAQAEIDTPPLQLIEECLRDPPAVISKDDLEVTAASEDERRAIDDLLKARYRQTDSGYFVRNDMLERLALVMLPCTR
ncbi:MAG TPA: hypothetical protein VHD36_09510 [Pirellulales bacterium]|nr:hypothetical protein [Pirellulales bacterium]